MFISVLDLFKIGIGPSSSHTLGPMVAAHDFIKQIVNQKLIQSDTHNMVICCTLKGSLAFTGKGHSTDRAVALGLHGYLPSDLTATDVSALIKHIWDNDQIQLDTNLNIKFNPAKHIIFDKVKPLPEHPNGMVFELLDADKNIVYTETYFSIGGGFICTQNEISQLQAPLKMESSVSCRYPFDSASTMLKMAEESSISIAQMKLTNELEYLSEASLTEGMDNIWNSMKTCVEKGLKAEGTLPGGLNISRRAKALFQDINQNPDNANINDWLCAYAMAVNEENAAGNMVVTAPTNGAAGVIPAVLFYFVQHEGGTKEQIYEFLLTASAIGGLIKHRSSS